MPTLRRSSNAGPTRRATVMKYWNRRRLMKPASSMRIVTWVIRFSSTRGGAK